MEILHDFLFSPTGTLFLPCSGWSELGSGNYHHVLGTSLPVLQLPRVLSPSARTAPPCSSLFPLPQPGAIPFPIQQTANLCAKKVYLHLPLKEVIMLMLFSTPLASSNALALPCIPGCCHMCGKDEEFPLPPGGEEAGKTSPAKHSTLLWEDGGRDDYFTLTNSYCFSHCNQWPLSRVS